MVKNGGERGIRTLDTISDIHDFQSCSLDRSDISPKRKSSFISILDFLFQ